MMKNIFLQKVKAKEGISFHLKAGLELYFVFHQKGVEQIGVVSIFAID